MKQKKYNRIQVYLDDETLKKFQQHCDNQGVKVSSEVKRLILVELQGKPVNPLKAVADDYNLEKLQKRLERLEIEVDLNRQGVEEFFRFRREEALKAEEEVKELIPEQSQFNSTESHSNSKLTLEEEKGLENLERKPLANPIEEEIEESQNELDDSEPELPPIEEAVASLDNEQSAENEIEVTVPDKIVSSPRRRSLLPKDLEDLNARGGVVIRDSDRLDDATLERFFLRVLKSRFILEGIDRQGLKIWVCGSKYVKTRPEPTQVKLYHSQSRTNVAAKRLSKKYFCDFQMVSAYNFLIGQTIEDRGTILDFWGIKYRFEA